MFVERIQVIHVHHVMLHNHQIDVILFVELCESYIYAGTCT